MKFTTHEETVGDDKNAQIVSEVKVAFAEAHNMLPNSHKAGRLIVEIESADSTEPYFRLDISPKEYGKGENCAPEKILTLRKNPGITQTGELRGSHNDVGAYLDKDHITYYGGVQVKLVLAERETEKPFFNGVIRIAYSGAPEWQDVYIALNALSAVARALAKICPEGFCHCYCTEALVKLLNDPISGFHMKLLKINW